jgi:hypothetical protein
VSETERATVNKSLLAFALVLITQTAGLTWWAATLQANVQFQDERMDSLVPRVEKLEADYFRRGNQ